jgi:hypothetical protein
MSNDVAKDVEKYVIHTKDGCVYQIHYIHSSYGKMILKIQDPEEDKYDDLDALENDLIKLIGVNYIVCMEEHFGDTIIVPEKIINESVLAIHKIN